MTSSLIGFTCGTRFAHSTLDLSAMTSPASHADSHPYLVVHSLCVLPAYRGRGVAKQLLSAALQKAKDSGAKGARLMCHEESVAMYEGWGWRSRGESLIEYGEKPWWELGLDWETGT